MIKGWIKKNRIQATGIRGNRGFSLIELIIAMAIMTLLITPILINLGQSLQVSAQAKEKQYAVDNANLVMDYFQRTSLTNLDKGSSEDGVDYDSTKVTHHDSTSGAPIQCDLCQVGSDGSVTTIGQVSYNATDFALDPVELGRAKNEYDRTVILDDLNNKILAANKQVVYTFKRDNIPDDFELRADGSAVHYNADTPRHIDKIVVEDHKVGSTAISNYQDPNVINHGNVQDLDSDKVAIVEGYATTYDQKFESDMVSQMMEIVTNKYYEGLKSEDPAARAKAEQDYETYTNQLQDYFESIRDNRSSMTRLIKVSSTGVLKAGTTKDEIDHYHVSVDIYYQAEFTFDGVHVGGANNTNYPGQFHYPVYSKNFYTSTPPDIYLYYEPFIQDTSKNRVWYSYNDYIAVYGDQYTSGTTQNNKVKDPSNLYLIKAEKNWQSTGNVSTQDPTRMTSDVFYTTRNGVPYPVQIYVNWIKDKSTTADVEPMHIYANFDIRYNEIGNSTAYKKYNGKYIIDNYIEDATKYAGISGTDDQVSTSGLKQFRTDYFKQDMSETSPNLNAPVMNLADSNQENVKYTDGYILPYLEYSSQSSRLYSITVELVKKSNGEVTTFTGAKGAD